MALPRVIEAGEIQRYRFTADEFQRMVEVGLFVEDDRLELIEGDVIEMTPVGSSHASIVDRLNRLFSSRLLDHAIVRVQSPIRLSRHAEPQPDVTLLRVRKDFYQDALPSPADVLLVVEVSHSSLAYDRDTKVPLYARSGIAEYWIVDLEVGCVHVYREPGAQGYGSARTHRRGGAVAPGVHPDVSFAVDEILGEGA